MTKDQETTPASFLYAVSIRLGSALAALEIAADQIDRGIKPAKVAEYLRKKGAELRSPPD